MIWLLSILLFILITFLIVDFSVVGALHPAIKTGAYPESYLITKSNHTDYQHGYECSGFSSAYVLRHFGKNATGLDIYNAMPCKMTQGYVYPKGILRYFHQLGYQAKFCRGTIRSLKYEISKGTPVIVLICMIPNTHYYHYLPVIGYDHDYLYLVESVEDFANCSDLNKPYNRKILISDFMKLWNLRDFRMPFYKNCFYQIY